MVGFLCDRNRFGRHRNGLLRCPPKGRMPRARQGSEKDCVAAGPRLGLGCQPNPLRTRVTDRARLKCKPDSFSVVQSKTTSAQPSVLGLDRYCEIVHIISWCLGVLVVVGVLVSWWWWIGTIPQHISFRNATGWTEGVPTSRPASKHRTPIENKDQSGIATNPCHRVAYMMKALRLNVAPGLSLPDEQE